MAHKNIPEGLFSSMSIHLSFAFAIFNVIFTMDCHVSRIFCLSSSFDVIFLLFNLLSTLSHKCSMELR